MRMAGPLPVSLVVITRDAAADIQECLLSAQICADALVVDSGSGDHTVEAARRSGARFTRRLRPPLHGVDRDGFGDALELRGTEVFEHERLAAQELLHPE